MVYQNIMYWYHIFHFPLAKLDGIINRKAKGKPASPMLPDSDDEDDPYGEKEADMRLGKKRVRRKIFGIYAIGKYNEQEYFTVRFFIIVVIIDLTTDFYAL